MNENKITILTIGGSPHQDGTSYKMLQCFTGLLREACVEHSLLWRHYDAFACGFAPCTDCRACRTFEGCVNPDMDEFFRDFENADGIVIATPIYNLSFPAPLKAIFDRTQRYYNARFSLGKRPPIAKHRPAALLMAAGDPHEDGAVAVQQLQRSFTVTNCTLVCHIICAGTDDISDGESFSPSTRDGLVRCVKNFEMHLA